MFLRDFIYLATVSTATEVASRTIFLWSSFVYNDAHLPLFGVIQCFDCFFCYHRFMDIALLLIFVIVTWIIHVFVSSTYRKWLKPVKSMQFRTVHVFEIFILSALMMLIYKSLVTSDLSATRISFTTLTVLVLLDGALLYFFKSARGLFDIWHFICAYLAVVTAVVLIFVK